MSARDENCQSDEHRASLTRLPQLAEPTIQFNLAKELEQLHHAGAWDKTSGRSSKTLAKYADFRIVLVSMKANTRMEQHRAEGRISIQCLAGRTSHTSSEYTKSGDGSRGFLGSGLWDSPRC